MMLIEAGKRSTVIEGDVGAALKSLADKSVHCCVTSPPYWGLRDYGHAGQLGLEKTPQEYVERKVAVFADVRRVLRDDGTLWLNLGDSYAASGKKGSGGIGKGTIAGGRGQSTNKGSFYGAADSLSRHPSDYGLKEKDLVGIPWRVAFALQADGWYLRQDIIWSKPNPMPESVRDRCTKAHEYIFMLSKSPRYYYDAAAIAEPISASYAKDNRPDGVLRNRLYENSKLVKAGMVEKWEGTPDDYAVRKTTRNKHSVWTVTTKSFKGAHFATFPPDLIEPCILAGSPKDGVVLDPFAGSGTTGMVAERHGRSAILIELNPDYTAMIQKRLELGK